MTPLHVALDMGHVDIARLLLKHGADMNSRDNSRNTPLHLASEYGHLETVRLLVERGANIDAEDR